ncbi:hypothetical protein LXL04_025319 [Taraxacum kok-saghyz]
MEVSSNGVLLMIVQFSVHREGLLSPFGPPKFSIREKVTNLNLLYINHESLKGTSHAFSPNWKSLQDDYAQNPHLSSRFMSSNCILERFG